MAGEERLVDRQLQDECARQLRSQRDEWRRRLEAIEADRRRANGGLPADFEDQATQRENDETLDALDDRGRQALAAVDAALDRIDAGTYGDCAVCGGRIPDDRLRAEPAAPSCIECAAAGGD